MKSDNINELARALTKVQAELKPVPRGSENPFFKSRYAELSACIKHAAPLLAQHGLAVVQIGEPNSAGVTLQTLLIHESGQWISSNMTVKPTKDDPQGYGSALTYLRRYGYMSIIGLAQEGDDDDGNYRSDIETAAPHISASVKTNVEYDQDELINKKLQEAIKRRKEGAK